MLCVRFKIESTSLSDVDEKQEMVFVCNLAKFLGVSNHLVHRFPRFVVVGWGDHKLFNLENENGYKKCY